jgi:hypothetical protein
LHWNEDIHQGFTILKYAIIKGFHYDNLSRNRKYLFMTQGLRRCDLKHTIVIL